MSLSTHVLDTAAGRPAAGVAVTLQVRDAPGSHWRTVAEAVTDGDGRVAGLVAQGALVAGVHRLVFGTGAYFAAQGQVTFWPEVAVTFEVTAPGEHHHVPLLVSPHGYTTYRGS